MVLALQFIRRKIKLSELTAVVVAGSRPDEEISNDCDNKGPVLGKGSFLQIVLLGYAICFFL